MNLNLINLDCSKWSREDWTDAYSQYCQTNMFGPKSKREYYEFVKNNHERLKSAKLELSEELQNKWINGFKNASAWAKKRGCNMNGVALENCRPKINLEDLQNDVKDIQWQMMHKRKN